MLFELILFLLKSFCGSLQKVTINNFFSETNPEWNKETKRKKSDSNCAIYLKFPPIWLF